MAWRIVAVDRSSGRAVAQVGANLGSHGGYRLVGLGHHPGWSSPLVLSDESDAVAVVLQMTRDDGSIVGAPAGRFSLRIERVE